MLVLGLLGFILELGNASPVKITFFKNHTASVMFPDNSTDTIILTPSSNLKVNATPCLFSGHLRDDNDSMVTVSGCHDDEEIIVTMSSMKIPGGLIDLVIKDGNHEVIATDMAKGRILNVESRLDGKPKRNNDVLIPPPNFNAPTGMQGSSRMPYKAYLELQIAYDRTLLSHFNYDHTATKRWIDRVIQLTRPRFNSLNLPTKIELKIVGEFEHREEEVRATKSRIDYLSRRYKPKVLMSWFAKDLCDAPEGEYCQLGMAYQSAGCRRDGTAIAISEFYSEARSEVLSSRVHSNSLGHLLGMYTDVTTECKGRGIMSHGDPLVVPDTWSKCSVRQFKKWYKNEGFACLRSANSPDPSKRVYTKSRGWCIDQRGKSNYDYETVEGNFPTGDDCANEVKKFMVYGGATYNPESRECLSITGQAVKGGPESKNYYCYAFKFHDPNDGPWTTTTESTTTTTVITTTTTAFVDRVFTKSKGWCVDFSGNFNWDYWEVTGNIRSGVECANIVKKDMINGGAAFNTRTGKCYRFKGPVAKGGPNYLDNDCYAFRDPKDGPVTTTTSKPVVKSFKKLNGWCKNSSGQHEWSYFSVDGTFSDGQGCAKAAMQKPYAKAAVFNTRSKMCYYLTKDVTSAGGYRDFDCYIFQGANGNLSRPFG